MCNKSARSGKIGENYVCCPGEEVDRVDVDQGGADPMGSEDLFQERALGGQEIIG